MAVASGADLCCAMPLNPKQLLNIDNHKPLVLTRELITGPCGSYHINGKLTTCGHNQVDRISGLRVPLTMCMLNLATVAATCLRQTKVDYRSACLEFQTLLRCSSQKVCCMFDGDITPWHAQHHRSVMARSKSRQQARCTGQTRWAHVESLQVGHHLRNDDTCMFLLCRFCGMTAPHQNPSKLQWITSARLKPHTNTQHLTK